MATTATTQPRPEKVAVVEEVRQRLQASSAVLLTEYRGLDVAALAELRRRVRAAGGEYRVFKNTLVRLAVADLEGLGEITELLVGPTALAFVDEDAVAVAKALQGFARDHPALTMKGGLLGTTFLSAAQATELARMASRDELLGRFAGGLAGLLRGFAGLLAALPRNFAYALAALVEQGGAAPEAATPEPAAEAPTPEPAAEAATPEPPDAEAPDLGGAS